MPKTNGYALFLYDQARKRPEEAGEDPTFQRLQAKFDHAWHALPQEEKADWKRRAKAANPALATGGGGGGNPWRYSSRLVDRGGPGPPNFF